MSHSGQDKDNHRGLDNDVSLPFIDEARITGLSTQEKAAGIVPERIKTTTSSKPDSGNHPNFIIYGDSYRSGTQAETNQEPEHALNAFAFVDNPDKATPSPFNFQANKGPRHPVLGVQSSYVEEPVLMSSVLGTNIETNAGESGKETHDFLNIPRSVRIDNIQPERAGRPSESKPSPTQVHLSSKKKGTTNKRSKKRSKLEKEKHRQTESESELPDSSAAKSVNETNESDIEESETGTSDDGGTSTSAPSKPVSRRKKVDAKRRKSPSIKEARKSSSRAERSAGKIAAMEVLKAIAEASAAMSKENNKSREEGSVDHNKKALPPIKFKDAVGRKFIFPFHIVQTWGLIRQAFLHVEVLGRHVAEGHYDLIGPNGDIILPRVWEQLIEPGFAITMHMWPMPEPPPGPHNAPRGPPSRPPHAPSGGARGPPGPPPRWHGGPPPPPAPLSARNRGEGSSGPAGPTIITLKNDLPREKRRTEHQKGLQGGTFGGSSRQATAESDKDEKPKPKRSWTLRKSLEDQEALAPPPKPPKTLFTDEGDIDNSYQAAQSMFLGKSFQAYDFKVLVVWDLLRLQREVIDKLDAFREDPEDDTHKDGFFKTLAEYRTVLRDWQEIERFPRSSRSEVHAFDLHLKNQLSSDEHKRLCGTSQWLGSVVNLTVNEEKAASKVRSFLQRILPDTLAMSSDEAQYEEQVTALALGTGPRVRSSLTDIEAGADDDSSITVVEMPARKEAYSSFVDALARLLISISGGLLLVVPMIVLVKVQPLNWRLGIVAISVLLFAIAVSQMSRATNQELLTSVAAYAAVLTVFFGQIG